MFKHLPKFNLPGSAHFVTTNAHLNVPIFGDPFAAVTVLKELAFYRTEYGFKVIGYVVMPEHFHCIVWWDETAKRELTIGKIMQGIKGSSSRRIIDQYISTGSRSNCSCPPGSIQTGLIGGIPEQRSGKMIITISTLQQRRNYMRSSTTSTIIR